MPAAAYGWKSEDGWQELVLSFYNLDPGNQTQIIRIGGRHTSWHTSRWSMWPESFPVKTHLQLGMVTPHGDPGRRKKLED